MITWLLVDLVQSARKGSSHVLRWVFALLIVGFGLGMLVPAATVAQGVEPAAGGTMLDVTLEHDLLPSELGFTILGRTYLEPGARQTLPERGEQGTIVIVVEAGALTYQIEGEGRIVRGADSGDPKHEAAPSGAPFTLVAGDALVYPAQGRIEANESAGYTVFLYAVILTPIGPPDPNPSDVGVRFEEELGYVDGFWPELVSGPVTIEVSQIVLESGESLPRALDGIRMVSQDTGEAGALVTDPDGKMRNRSDWPIDVLVLSIEPAMAEAASVF